MDILAQILYCVLGTLGFAITMKADKHTLVYIAIGALIAAGIERTLSIYTNDFISCLSAMMAISLYCEVLARIIKEPTTVILMPSVIPLLPGSAIYYTMLYAINGEKDLLIKFALSTIMSGLGIALGAVISSAIIKIILSGKSE